MREIPAPPNRYFIALHCHIGTFQHHKHQPLATEFCKAMTLPVDRFTENLTKGESVRSRTHSCYDHCNQLRLAGGWSELDLTPHSSPHQIYFFTTEIKHRLLDNRSKQLRIK